MVDYTKDGVTNQIYSPFEFREEYNKPHAPPEERRKRNVYLIFLKPKNKIRPYAVNMTGTTVQEWTKEEADWRLSDCLADEDTAEDTEDDNSGLSDNLFDDIALIFLQHSK